MWRERALFAGILEVELRAHHVLVEGLLKVSVVHLLHPPPMSDLAIVEAAGFAPALRCAPAPQISFVSDLPLKEVGDRAGSQARITVHVGGRVAGKASQGLWGPFLEESSFFGEQIGDGGLAKAF